MIAFEEKDLLDAIKEVMDKQFPEAELDDYLNKAIEELDEVLNAPKSKRLMEFADIFICVVSALMKDGWSYPELMQAVAVKTIINSVRKFERQPDGTYKHLPEE